MPKDYGKKFEGKFKEDWLKTFPKSFCFRVPDQMTGYKLTSQNPCDFICFVNQTLFLLECKSHKGASIPFEDIPQYDRLIKYVGLKDVRCGVILWLYEKDIGVLYIPISTLQKMKADREKSVGIRHLDNDKYVIYRIPSEKRRFFYDTDYTCLLDLKDKE